MRRRSWVVACAPRPSTAPTRIVAELGGMRFPVSSTAFYHYVDKLGPRNQTLPQPLDPGASGSTVIDLEGETITPESLADLPALFQEVADAWADAPGSRLAIRRHPAGHPRSRRAAPKRAVERPWCRCGTTAPSTTSSPPPKAFAKLSFHHREVFGQVGFGTGGWDSDFPTRCWKSSAW